MAAAHRLLARVLPALSFQLLLAALPVGVLLGIMGAGRVVRQLSWLLEGPNLAVAVAVRGVVKPLVTFFKPHLLGALPTTTWAVLRAPRSLAHPRLVALACFQALAAVVVVQPKRLMALLVVLAAFLLAAVAAVVQPARASLVVRAAQVAQDMWRFTHGKRLRSY